jgi:ferric hydroxamate transport system ATP-binding protein
VGDRQFARKVAYLPQATPRAIGMVVKKLVALGRYPWHGALGRFGRIDRKKVEEAMMLVGVTFADRLVDTLSRSERERVLLAMLVAQDAECLLLDGPISALSLGHRLSQDRSLGVVAVLHGVNMAAHFCDEIIALHSGRLIALGSPSDIMTTEKLADICGIPMGVMPHPDTGQLLNFVQRRA